MRWILCSLLLLAGACVSTVTEQFGMYGISDVLEYYEGDTYHVEYYMYTTPNVTGYSTTYYQMVDGQWTPLKTEWDDVSEKDTRVYKGVMAIPDGYELSYEVPIRIEVILHSPAIDGTFTQTEDFEYTFE